MRGNGSNEQDIRIIQLYVDCEFYVYFIPHSQTMYNIESNPSASQN